MDYPCITATLSEEIREIEIIGIGDVHYGSPEHNAKLFNEIIEKIKNQDNLYCILLGDLIECVTKDSVGDLYTQKGTPQEQADHIVEKLTPIRHKILAMTGGNHENRVFKTSGFDINSYIAYKLGIIERYVKNSFLLFVRFGRQRGSRQRYHNFSIVVSHGVGSGVKKSSKINAITRLQETIVGADVYIIGHVHDYICTYSDVFCVDTHNKKVKQKTSCLLSQGAFLDFGGYGYEKGYKPLSQKFGIITLGYIVKHANDERYIQVRG